MTEKIFFIPVPEEEFFQRIAEAEYSDFMQNNLSLVNSVYNGKWLNHVEAVAFQKTASTPLYKYPSVRAVEFTKRSSHNSYRVEDLYRGIEDGIIKTTIKLATEGRLTPRRNYSINKHK